MMQAIRTIRRHEEGQALVLAAVALLILALSALATVNLSYAVSQKIRLQNAADAAAYTTAGVQARALNFFAITNRAQVVHYVAHMNLLAVLSYGSFVWSVFQVLRLIPYVGMIFGYVATFLQYLLTALDWIFVFIGPVLDGLNFGITASQFAVQSSMLVRAARGGRDEVRAYNPAYEVSPLMDVVDRLDSLRRWSNTVSTGLNPFTPSNDRESVYARGVMTEIANSGRSEWTLHGNRRITGFLIPRRMDWLCNSTVLICKDARTEWGQRQPGGFLSNFFGISDEMYSTDLLLVGINFRIFRFNWWFGFKVNAHRQLGDHQPQAGWETRPRLPRLLRYLAGQILDPPVTLYNNMARQLAHGRRHWHFGQVPYARFRPTAEATKWFQQPPVLVSVVHPTSDLAAKGRPFMGRFHANMGLSSVNSTLMRETGRRFNAAKRGYQNSMEFAPNNMTRRGLPSQVLRDGFNAMSAAITYYHRPGDWREPPNTFNPFWGAKLLPIIDYPNIANASVLSTIVNRNFFLH